MVANKIICVGRNYADHATELGNAIPTQPMFFMKPSTSLNTTRHIDIQSITRNSTLGELHFECELCVQIGKNATRISAHEAMSFISGVTLGLDLTLRDIQNDLKAKGHPWERAKAFDNACVLGDWLDPHVITDYSNASYELFINNTKRQTGNTHLMLFPIAQLISEISQSFTLNAGDVIMTGTPSGVGALTMHDSISMRLATNEGVKEWQVTVI